MYAQGGPGLLIIHVDTAQQLYTFTQYRAFAHSDEHKPVASALMYTQPSPDTPYSQK